MSLLQQIHRGKQPLPPRLIVYGTEGIGKSTFAAQAPSPVFVQTEDGLGEIACDKFPLATRFDSWEGFPEEKSRFERNVEGHRDKLDLIVDHSFRALRSLPLHGFDFAEVDGAHEGMNVLEDGVLAWRLLKVGGVLIFDDYQYVNRRRTIQPRQAIDAFLCLYPVTVLHKSWQVIVRKEQENYYLQPNAADAGRQE